MTPTRPSFLRYLCTTSHLVMLITPAAFAAVGVYGVIQNLSKWPLLLIPAGMVVVWLGARIYHWRKLPLVVERTFGEMVSSLDAERPQDSRSDSPNASVSGVRVYPDENGKLPLVEIHYDIKVADAKPEDVAGVPVFGAYDEGTDVERTVFISNTGNAPMEKSRFPLGEEVTLRVLPYESKPMYVSADAVQEEQADCVICKKLAGVEADTEVMTREQFEAEQEWKLNTKVTDVVVCSRCFKPKTDLALPPVALCACASITYKPVGDVTAIETGTPNLKLGAGKLYVVEQKEISDRSGNELVGEVTDVQFTPGAKYTGIVVTDALMEAFTSGCEVREDGHTYSVATGERISGESGLAAEAVRLSHEPDSKSGCVVVSEDQLPETVSMMDADSGEKCVLTFRQLRDILGQCEDYKGTVEDFVSLAESADNKGDGFGTLFHFSVCGSEGAVGADDCLCPRLLAQVSIAGNFTDEMASHAELNNIRGRLWRAPVEEAKPIHDELMAARKRVADKKAKRTLADLSLNPVTLSLEPNWFWPEQHMTFDVESCTVTWWSKDEQGVWKRYTNNSEETRKGNLELIAGHRHFPHCNYPNGRIGKPGCVCEKASAKLKEGELATARDLALYANRMNQHKLAGVCFAYVEDLKVTNFFNAYENDERRRHDFEARRQEAFEARMAEESESFEDDEEGDAEAESAVDAVSDIILEGDEELEKHVDDHADVINAIIAAEERGDRVEAERLAGDLLRSMAGIKKPEPVKMPKRPERWASDCSCECHHDGVTVLEEPPECCDQQGAKMCGCDCHEDSTVRHVVPCCAFCYVPRSTRPTNSSAVEVQVKAEEQAVVLSKAREVIAQQIETAIIPAVVEAAKVEQKGEVFQPVKEPSVSTTLPGGSSLQYPTTVAWKIGTTEAEKVERNFRTKPLRYIVTPDPGAVPCGVLEGGVTNTKVMLSNNNLGAMMRVETAAKTPYHTRRCSYWKDKATCSCKFAKRKFNNYV